MVKVVITMAAVPYGDGKWRTRMYCYEEDDGDGIRVINAATSAIRDALEQAGKAAGEDMFDMGRPPPSAVPFWDVWVGTEQVTRKMWVNSCDYRKRPGCPQGMVHKMMEAYRALCADCYGKTRKDKKGSKHA